MSWIQIIDYPQADARLKKMYDRVKGPDNNVDNVLLLHSLRPHTLTGHMTLYKSVLHHSGNTLPKWYLEALGVYVSHLNRCNYCVAHHFEGFKRLLGDEARANAFMELVGTDTVTDFFGAPYDAGFAYAKKLTLNHTQMKQPDVQALRDAGLDDGQVLEINQLVSYFCYVNRSVLGLGIDTQGDIIGLSPNDSDDPTNWNHQ